ncbi:hypothetical protein PsorP6_002172 [Peronosclerospora sorghi]|uniref:Uncharacterized protein n=1 Tax=Peronosclerospora sorghi TaxID=230839 RepID=A0ACC0WWH3_9STRA|nr:hypothetical protein PsorP6_002172 [Peronosclerospora sorghi]
MENVKRGKLKLKTTCKLKVASKQRKYKKKVSKHQESNGEQLVEQEKSSSVEIATDDDDMTPAQRRHAAHQKKREHQEIEKLASKTYRERIEELNQHLGSLTEHHDVPRVSNCYCRLVVASLELMFLRTKILIGVGCGQRLSK